MSNRKVVEGTEVVNSCALCPLKGSEVCGSIYQCTIVKDSQNFYGKFPSKFEVE